MSIPSQLIATLNDVSRDKIILKEDKNFIGDNLSFLQQFADSGELKNIRTVSCII